MINVYACVFSEGVPHWEKGLYFYGYSAGSPKFYVTLLPNGQILQPIFIESVFSYVDIYRAELFSIDDHNVRTRMFEDQMNMQRDRSDEDLLSRRHIPNIPPNYREQAPTPEEIFARRLAQASATMRPPSINQIRHIQPTTAMQPSASVAPVARTSEAQDSDLLRRCRRVYVADKCPICFDHLHEGDVIAPPCNHAQHVDCLAKWVATNGRTCTVCRAPF